MFLTVTQPTALKHWRKLDYRNWLPVHSRQMTHLSILWNHDRQCNKKAALKHSQRLNAPVTQWCYHTAFHIGSYIKPSVNNCPRRTSLSYDQTYLFLSITKFICQNSLLEYAESNWWMTDSLLQCLYSVLALAATINQRCASLPTDIWKLQTKLWSTEALALISAPGISTVANDNGPLLGYINPSASDASRLIYVDRMINAGNTVTQAVDTDAICGSNRLSQILTRRRS